jgi:hypothetical protein
LKSQVAQLVINCGRNSLDVFCLATVLSFLGFIAMLEGGRTFEYQIAVNGAGLALMGSAAWWLTYRKGQLAARPGGPAAGTSPAPSDEAGTL